MAELGNEVRRQERFARWRQYVLEHPSTLGAGFSTVTLAETCAHWHHNAWISEASGRRSGDNSGPLAPNDLFFADEYAALYAEAKLRELLAQLDGLPPGAKVRRDIEMEANNLMVALDARRSRGNLMPVGERLRTDEEAAP